MEAWLLRTWYGDTRRGLWLLPLAWLFGAVVALRRIAFQAGLLRVHRLSRPVIVIGNITVGGTGKTPLTLWLARRLAGRGLRPGIVSRGYGGREAGARLVAPDASPAEVGDEPALMAARRVARVAVGADRPAAAALLEQDCDVILSDDGLQHLALGRDAEIIVIDGLRGLGNGRLLPAGPLREPEGRLAHADLLVVTGGQFAGLESCEMRVEPVALVALAGAARRPLSSLAGQRVHAVAAIGNPERFFALLRTAGLEVVGHALPDHHALASSDLDFGDDLPVLMTEKYAVKCRSFARAGWEYLEVEAGFAPDDVARLDALLDRALARAR